MKRFFSVFLCLAICLSASAYDFEDEYGFYYNIISDSDVEVTYGDEQYAAFASIVFPSTVTYNSATYCVTAIGNYAFRNNAVSYVEIPNSVTSIGVESFFGCNYLSHFIIPENVTFIGAGAFYDCPYLYTIECLAAIPPTIESNTFGNYDITLYVPANSVSLYQSAEYWKEFNIQQISDGPTALDYNLADRNVIYVNGRVYNEDGLNIKLFDASGRLISSGNTNIDMSSCPNGIYIVTDGKGGSLKINHYR